MTAVRRRRRVIAIAVLVAAAVAAGACGRRGDPRPPEDVLPETITSLEAKNVESGVLLRWRRPDRYTGGGKMRDLGSFTVQRATGDDPAPTFRVIKTIPVEDRDRFRQVANFRYVDEDVERGARYRYRIVSRTTDNYVSAPSNEVEIVRSNDE